MGLLCPNCRTMCQGIPALKEHMAVCQGVPPPPSQPGSSAPHFQQGKQGIPSLKVWLFLKHGCGSASLWCGSGSRFSLNSGPDPGFPFNADPDPVFHFKLDPDPGFHFYADPDTNFHFNSDPDPSPHLWDGNLQPLVYWPSMAPYWAPQSSIVTCECPRPPNGSILSLKSVWI